MDFNFQIFENFTVKFSFLTLFLSMLMYWGETFFVNSLTSFSNQASQVSATNSLTFPNSSNPKSNWNLGNKFLALSAILIFLFLCIRCATSGHFPLSNLFESLMFLAWSLAMIQLFLDSNFQNQFIGCVTSPTILLIHAFGSFSLPKDMQIPTALVPALQSNWLMMHVTLMILSYGALIIGCLFSMAYLVLSRFFQSTRLSPTIMTLDNLSYRILGIGFPLLTIGILSGAVWANEAWGSYWSWDPKETWALFTWLIFAIYLHTRITKGWTGSKPALIATGGFFSVWICFLGVNLLGQGLHSYGWVH